MKKEELIPIINKFIGGQISLAGVYARTVELIHVEIKAPLIEALMHVACFCRIIKDGRIILSGTDKFFPADEDDIDFDYGKGHTSVFDECAEALGRESLGTVKSVDFKKESGDLIFHCTNGVVVEILNDRMRAGDAWWIMEGADCEGTHYVLSVRKGGVCYMD